MYNVCRVMVTDSFSPRIELLVEFVDGVTRLELMKKADELKVVANTTTYPTLLRCWYVSSLFVVFSNIWNLPTRFSGATACAIAPSP